MNKKVDLAKDIAQERSLELITFDCSVSTLLCANNCTVNVYVNSITSRGI
jgi:hypothetical protein